MNLQALSSDPNLKKLIRECDKGDLLFSEGDTANTVFLVLEGTLELIVTKQSEKLVLGRVQPGEFIGERALLQEENFKRKASALAKSQTFLLELGPDQFSRLEKEAPGVYLFLLKKAFKTLISRNESLEKFCDALKSYDPRERFLSYLLSQAQSQRLSADSFPVHLESAQLATILNCQEPICAKWLTDIEAWGCMKASQNQFYWDLNLEQLQQLKPEDLETALAA